MLIINLLIGLAEMNEHSLMENSVYSCRHSFYLSFKKFVLQMKKLYTLLIGLFLSVHIATAQTPGNTLNFDGINDYITAPLPSVFSNIPGNDFTIEAWIKPTGNAFSRILYAQQNATNFAALSISAGNQIYFYVNNSTSAVTSSSLPIGVWSHVACTWNASASVMEIYIDGLLQTTSPGGTSSTGTNNIMTIGSRTDGAQYFQGDIDEIRIWNVVRTACEIYSTRNSTYSTTSTNLVAYYNFNQGASGAVNTGNNVLPEINGTYNGTLLNFTLAGNTSNWMNSGAGINNVNQFNGMITFIDNRTECNSYTWFEGTTFTTSTNAFYIYQGVGTNGCDSTINLQLIILNSPTSTDNQTACSSFTWIDGNTYTANNDSATYTYPAGAANGCDSIVTLNLTILTPTTGTDVQTACEVFTWIDGITYTVDNDSATYTYPGAAANGCDSIVTLNLTINSVSNSFTTTSGTSITANNSNASYQWLNCDNGYAEIPGETSQIFTTTVNGNYAVELTENGCIDTSSCVSINSVGLINKEEMPIPTIYPNPTNGVFTVELPNTETTVFISIRDINGKLISSERFDHQQKFDIVINEPSGVYFVTVATENMNKVLKLVKK
jgi:hypothetical protein